MELFTLDKTNGKSPHRHTGGERISYDYDISIDCKYTLIMSDLTQTDQGSYWCLFNFTDEMESYNTRKEMLKITSKFTMIHHIP